MSNMSYCRFRNTLEDLRDCADHMETAVSEDEARARRRLVKLCAEIASGDYGDLHTTTTTEGEEDE